MVVPTQIRFADMRLNLTAEARKKIQTDVDALTRYEKYFNAKVAKVDAYLPLIEQVLREENVPDDIKYLVIQESALVGDAVSSSNAVGYWQFKEATGREVGLTINREVDERMNIITATRGAARYFKNNNTFFDNWLYALLAYYAGPGGALKIADKKYYGKREMKLDGRTHWYVLKYLAHKIAFEQAVGKNPRPEKVLFAYTDGNGKTLAQVAAAFDLEEADLEPHNRWVQQRRIPDDKQYYVIIPDYSGQRDELLLAETPGSPPADRTPRVVAQVPGQQGQAHSYVEVKDTGRFPEVKEVKRWGKEVTLVNNIKGTIVQEGENLRAVSQRTAVAPSRLVKFNDLNNRHASVTPGMPIYLRRKRNKGPVHYHVVETGETLWSVSQRFGIKLSKLKRNNRMREEETVKAGRVLWLRFIRPPHIPVEYRDVPGSQPNPALTANTSSAKTYEPARPKPDTPAQKPVSQSSEAEPQRPAEPLADTETATLADVERKTDPPTADASEEQVWTGDSPEETTRPEDEKVLAPVIDKPEKQSEAREYHRVQAGETLYSIARRYDLTIPQLTSYNNIDWEVPLSVGQKLWLSPPEEQAAPKTAHQPTEEAQYFHEVQSGETLYGIARQYDTTIKELMEWNSKDDFNVSVGERLRIMKK